MSETPLDPAALAASILASTKKAIGIDDEYKDFDLDITMFINSVFGTLAQLGIGPSTGFMIDDNTAVWIDFISEDTNLNLNLVKQYVFMRVRLSFDPPATSFHINALQEQIKELEVRISINREDKEWVDPSPTSAANAFWWEVGDNESLPDEMCVGDFAFDSDSGNVWRKA